MGVVGDFVAGAFNRRPKLFVFCLLTSVSLIAYGNSLPNSFHFDDIHGIVSNPAVRNLKYLPAYFVDPSTFTLATGGDWRPILQITYALNYFVTGLNPALFRLLNLLLHVGAAFLIYAILATMARDSPLKPAAGEHYWSITPPAIFSALLFAVHTVNAEAVNYIWARSSLLVAFFYLLAFYCFLRGPLSGQRQTNHLWHLGGLGCYALGLATKAPALTLPVVLVLYEVLFLNPASHAPFGLYRAEPQRLKKYLPVAALSVAYLALRFVLPSPFARLTAYRADPSFQTPFTFLLTEFRVWIYYLRLFLWPYPLIMDFHGFGWSHSLRDGRVLAALAVIAAALGLAWRSRKTEPLITFFTLWFFVALLPEGSFFPLVDPVFVYRAYLAYAGLSVAAAFLILRGGIWIWGKMKREGVISSSRFWFSYSLASGVILCILTAATIRRNLDWRTEMTLWSDVLKKDPTNPRAHMYLGLEFLDRENYREAGRMFEKAVELDPKDSYAHMLRGYFHSAVDKDDPALSDFNRAIRLNPRSHYNFFFRGELYRKMGQYDKALGDYQAALRLKPLYTDAQIGMARIFLKSGETAKLREACNKLIELDPDDPRGRRCLQVVPTEQNR